MRNSIVKILKYTKGFRWYLLLGVISVFISVFFSMLTPQIIRFTVDNVIDNIPFELPKYLSFIKLPSAEFFRDNLWVLALAVVAVTGIRAFSAVISRYCYSKFTENSMKLLRDDLYAHIGKLPNSWYSKNKAGDIIQRCTSDVNLVRQFLSGQLQELIRTIIMVFVATFIMMSMNVVMASIAILFVPIVIGYSLVFYKFIHRSFKASDEAEAELTVAVHENLTGVRVVRAFGREGYELDKFDNCNAEYVKKTVKLGALLGVNWGMGSFTTRLQIMLIVIVGIALTVNGAISVGELIIFVSYTQTLAWPIRSIARIISHLSKVGVATLRIVQILDEPLEIDELPQQKPDIKGAIEFRNVSFAYDMENVLKNVSFSIGAGQTVGVLGPTGSGKSTIAYLLTRLYDLPSNSGQILVDGVDINSIDRQHLRKNIALVLQETFLFSKTIAENVAITGDMNMDRIRHFTGISAIDNSIMEFDMGYDTVVGERGVTLSGGQKQRLAIARAIYTQPPVLILDDSMSAVDTATDMEIRNAIASLTGSTTMIIISHRISTLMRADKILVLGDGEIAEYGTHGELMQIENGIYRATYNAQAQASDSLWDM